MTLKSDAKFEEKQLLVWKMAWGTWWIFMRAVVSPKIRTLMFYFCQKYIMFEPKKGRGVVS